MTGYEGWKNRETWNVALWLDNEYPLYQQKVSFLRAVIQPIADLGATPAAVGFVQRWCESVFPKGTPDMQGAEKETATEQMRRVDWVEITEHFIAEVAEYAR